MPSFNDVVSGASALASDVNQIIQALKGTVGQGIPISITAVNDAINFALAVKNNDTGASKTAVFYKADGTVLLQVDKNGVIASPDGVAGASAVVTPTSAQALTNKTGITSTGAIDFTGATTVKGVHQQNLLVNPGFEIWQRGNGAFTATGTYSADRWVHNLAGTDTLSISKNTTAANLDTGSIASVACTFVLGTGAGTSNYGSSLQT